MIPAGKQRHFRCSVFESRSVPHKGSLQTDARQSVLGAGFTAVPHEDTSMIQHVCQERACNLIYHSPCTQSVTAADREHARTVTHEVGELSPGNTAQPHAEISVLRPGPAGSRQLCGRSDNCDLKTSCAATGGAGESRGGRCGAGGSHMGAPDQPHGAQPAPPRL